MLSFVRMPTSPVVHLASWCDGGTYLLGCNSLRDAEPGRYASGRTRIVWRHDEPGHPHELALSHRLVHFGWTLEELVEQAGGQPLRMCQRCLGRARAAHEALEAAAAYLEEQTR